MLRAGASMIDITPKAGTHLAGSGFGEYRPAETVMEPLYAKAVVLASDKRKVCIVSLDVILITEQYCDEIRNSVARLYGIEYDAIMVHVTQTHSAPGIGRFMFDPDLPVNLTKEMEFLGGGETEYSKFACDMTVKAVGEAIEKMRPVQVGAGRGIADKLAFNRRMVTRKGNVVMPGIWHEAINPAGPADMLYYEGPTDPEVGVLCLRDDTMKVVAMLLHFTCHPVNVFSGRRSWHAVSSDWPGTWSKEVQANFGSSCVPLVLNGCCGNINPWDPFEPNFVPDHRRMGKSLYSMTEKIINLMGFTDTDALDFQTCKIPLDYRAIPKERLEAIDKILAEHPQPYFHDENKKVSDNDWFMAASTKSIEYCRKRMPELPYEIHAFRIGDTAVVGLPGEPFVEGQLDIKVNSPAGYTYVAHCTSQYVGYLPVRDAYQRGGHEANEICTYWAKMAPDSLEKITKKAREMVEKLF